MYRTQAKQESNSHQDFIDEIKKQAEIGRALQNAVNSKLQNRRTKYTVSLFPKIQKKILKALRTNKETSLWVRKLVDVDLIRNEFLDIPEMKNDCGIQLRILCDSDPTLFYTITFRII